MVYFIWILHSPKITQNIVTKFLLTVGNKNIPVAFWQALQPFCALLLLCITNWILRRQPNQSEIRVYKPLQTSIDSSDPSSQSGSPSHFHSLGIHLRDALHWNRVLTSQVWLRQISGDSSLSSPQSLSPSQSHWREMQRPLPGQVWWSPVQVVNLQWLSSELSSQSLVPSHTCGRKTHLWFAHRNWNGAHCLTLQDSSSAPFGQSFLPLHIEMTDTHVVLSHWNIPANKQSKDGFKFSSIFVQILSLLVNIRLCHDVKLIFAMHSSTFYLT